ncbi:DsrE family protein [Marinobacter caseinilyticus]|uniref:DsrE family protein n=1 Tax=Marinobacter caseinilyticus TaxID=2692195 RepID=UPI00140A8F42|nr:DsrE family protein [Marinobacter caseinilyticus]
MNVLIVIDRAPYGDWSGRESLDMAFSLAAFDKPVALLFRGAGINWLRHGQLPEDIGQKSGERNLAAAPIFGVSDLLADQQAASDYRLTLDQLLPAASLVEVRPELYRQYDHVISL